MLELVPNLLAGLAALAEDLRLRHPLEAAVLPEVLADLAEQFKAPGGIPLGALDAPDLLDGGIRVHAGIISQARRGVGYSPPQISQ